VRGIGARSLGAAAGLVMDTALGDRPLRPHPVAAFGSLMNQVESRLYRDRRPAGVLHAAVGAAVGAGAGGALQRVLGPGRATAAATYVAVAQRQLATAAEEVAAGLAADDLDA